jgi:hypothetical protein
MTTVCVASGQSIVRFTGIHTASEHDHSGQSTVRCHPCTCIEALTKSMEYYELVRALCEEATVCILDSVPQFLKDLRKTGPHHWSRSTLRPSQAMCVRN